MDLFFVQSCSRRPLTKCTLMRSSLWKHRLLTAYPLFAGIYYHDICYGWIAVISRKSKKFERHLVPPIECSYTLLCDIAVTHSRRSFIGISSNKQWIFCQKRIYLKCMFIKLSYLSKVCMPITLLNSVWFYLHLVCFFLFVFSLS